MTELKKYLTKPQEVEAMQFSSDVAEELCEWIRSKGGEAHFKPEDRATKAYIAVVTDYTDSLLLEGWWIVNFGEGVVVVYSNTEFEESFTDV